MKRYIRTSRLNRLIIDRESYNRKYDPDSQRAKQELDLQIRDNLFMKVLGKDIWVLGRKSKRGQFPSAYFIKVLYETPSFYTVCIISDIDKGEYLKHKLENPSAFSEKIKKINPEIVVDPYYEMYSTSELVDYLEANSRLKNPEGYSLAFDENGRYYWHWDGDRTEDYIAYDMPIGYL